MSIFCFFIINFRNFPFSINQSNLARLKRKIEESHGPGHLTMLGKLISAIDALIYTFLAFVVPFYWTCKALLRQFTHSAAVSTTSKPVITVTTAAAEAEEESLVSVVSAQATEEVEFTSIPASFSSLSKPQSTSLSTTASTSANASSQNVLVNWLYYWALLSVFHVLTGAYEVVIVPVLGNSILYRLGKLGLLLWMNHDASGNPARLAWNSVVGPVVSAYERDVDALVARGQVLLRSGAVRVYASGRAFVTSKFSPVEPELKVD